MKKTQIILAISALSLSFSVNSANIIRTTAPIQVNNKPFEQWLPAESEIGDWVNSGDLYGCSSASPDAAFISSKATFLQSYNNCKQDQVRTVQNKEKSSLTGEIRNSGNPTQERRTLDGFSGTRTTNGTNTTGVSTYAITPGVLSGLGAGYYKQNGGGYNFGSSMQKTANGYQTYFAIIYYAGAYTVQFGASTGSALNATDNTKYSSSAFSPYISPYTGIRLLRADNSIIAEYNISKVSDIRNYYIKYDSISAAQFNYIYSIIGQVAKVQLFE